MPANPKYLNPNIGSRIAKISAAILGGLLVTVSLHMALAAWLDRALVIITSTYSAFILWVLLMMIAFMAKNGLKIWGIYLLVSVLCFALMYYAPNP